MTVSLGGYPLSDELVLTGLEAGSGLAYSSRQTFGRTVIQLLPIKGGVPVSLVSDGHLTLADVDAINVMKAAGQEVQLIHHRGTFTVVIVDVDVQPVISYSDPEPEDWCSGSINLLVK